MTPDYRDVVIEQLSEEIADLQAVVDSLVIWREMGQQALEQLRVANIQRAQMVVRLQQFMAMARGEWSDADRLTPPPARPIADFPTDTDPFVSVHELRWK